MIIVVNGFGEVNCAASQFVASTIKPISPGTVSEVPFIVKNLAYMPISLEFNIVKLERLGVKG